MKRATHLGATVAHAAVVCLAIASPSPARAQTGGESPEAFVVAVESDGLVLDLGAQRGVSDGDVVEIWRPVRVKHPVTGKVLTDRFLIGRLRLEQVRPNLSLAKPEGTLSRPAAVGDVVLVGHGSHLTLGFESVSVFGTRGYSRFDVVASRAFRVSPIVEVTDQPHASQAGVRLLTDFGFDLGSGWLLALRGGYQARSFDSGGPSAGGGLAYAF